MHRMRVLVTGASRQQGIGHAVVARLGAAGHQVLAQGWTPYDRRQPWGADPVPVPEVDLADPSAPGRLVAQSAPLDALVCAHAASPAGGLGDTDAAQLDLCWAVNVRATLLLVQAFAAQLAGPGQVVLLLSGTHRGPMPGELAYVATKGALHQLVPTLAAELTGRATVVGLNPGPTDTGWADQDVRDDIAARMPHRRWNTAADAAAVVELLLSPAAAALTGTVVDAEGGFRR